MDPGRRIQDPFGLRAFPQVQGVALDGVAQLRRILEIEVNAAAENPLVDADSGGVYHHGQFSTAYPALALDHVRAAVHHRTPGSGISARAAFSAATRGAWRAGGIRDGVTGTLTPGAPASYAIWDTGPLEVSTSANDAAARWSTDPRSRVPALPRLDAGTELPRCLRAVHRGAVLHG